MYNSPLELVYSDTWGPAPFPSINGACYYVHFIDAFSKYTWLYLIQSRSQLKSIFLHFQQMVELQLETKIKMFQSDNAAENVNLSRVLQAQGIIHKFSCPHIH